MNREEVIAALKDEIDFIEARAVDEQVRNSLTGGKEGSVGLVVSLLAYVVGLRRAVELLEGEEP
jgi:hypothetical protein